MQSSLKKSLYVGLAALGFVTVAGAANANTASAKTYAKTTSNKWIGATAANNITFNGSNALYTKAGTLKGAKLVASTTTLKKLAKSKSSEDNFVAYRVATTNRGSVYYKVVSLDKQYRGWIYGGKSTESFAGGIESYTTFKQDDKVNENDAKLTYKFKTVGTTNDGTMLTYKDPMYTVYGSGRVIKDSSAYKDDVLTITKQGTRTREGDQWVYVTDEANPNVSGWILKSGLTKTSDVPASQGVTVKYYDKNTNQLVKTVVVKADKDKTMDLTSADNLKKDINANKPAGYADAVKSDLSSNANAVKAGDTVNVYLTQNAAIQYNVTLYANNTAGEVAVNTNLYDYLTSTQKADLVKALQNNKAPEGSALTTEMINNVISAAGLDSFTFTGKDGNTYTATYNKSVQFVSGNTVTSTAKPNALYTITVAK